VSKTYDYANEAMQEASKIVNADRKDDYGDARDSFRSIAGFWTNYLRARGLLMATVNLTTTDVAMMMDLLKTSRFATGGYKADTFVDKVGYSALGGALARIEDELTKEAAIPINRPSSIYPDED
jgi:glutamate formiminotransferase